MATSRTFLSGVAARDAIRRVSEARRLTIFAGAGTSAEAGLPDWAELIERLLKRVAGGLPEDVRSSWMRRVAAQGLPEAAAVIAAHADGAVIGDLVEEELYQGGSPVDYAPGPISEAIAFAKGAWRRDARILTTNYDPLIEQALRRLGIWRSRDIRSYVVRKTEPVHIAAVTHLHGKLLPGEPRGRLVLSEEDYHLMQVPSIWQEELVAECLRTSLCLFVGSSFTDPNLVRYLYRHGAGGNHIAIFTRQAETRRDALGDALERSTSLRWKRCGVEALFADHFHEVGQFIWECSLRRSLGSSYRSYPQRQSTWFRSRAARVLRRGHDLAEFRRRQFALGEILDAVLDGVRMIARADGIDLREEALGLALWVTDYGRRRLELWASSGRVYRAPNLKAVDIESPSNWVAVEAVSRGTAVAKDPENYASRWRFVRGVPLWVDDKDEGRLLAGVFTLASTSPYTESRLREPPLGLYQAIDGFLTRSATQIFTELA